MVAPQYNKWIMLLQSRKFWAAVLGFVFLIIMVAVPDFPLDEDMAVNFAVLIVGYIVSIAIDPGLPGTVWKKFKNLFLSRKFLVSGVGVIFVFLSAYVPDFPITEELVLAFILMLTGYVNGIAIEDRLAFGTA